MWGGWQRAESKAKQPDCESQGGHRGGAAKEALRAEWQVTFLDGRDSPGAPCALTAQSPGGRVLGRLGPWVHRVRPPPMRPRPEGPVGPRTLPGSRARRAEVVASAEPDMRYLKCEMSGVGAAAVHRLAAKRNTGPCTRYPALPAVAA
jgi:hypothetical protein